MLNNKGIVTNDKNHGELMLEAALMGMVNVLKCFESPQYRLDFTNTFGEGLLHFAAKGNQKKMT